MKQVTTILAILVGFTMNAQWYWGAAMGVQQAACIASGDFSTAMGFTTASGWASTARGLVQPPLVVLPLQWGKIQRPLIMLP